MENGNTPLARREKKRKIGKKKRKQRGTVNCLSFSVIIWNKLLRNHKKKKKNLVDIININLVNLVAKKNSSEQLVFSDKLTSLEDEGKAEFAIPTFDNVPLALFPN